MRWKLGMAGLLLSLVVAAASPVAAAEPPSEKSFLLRYYYLDVTDSITYERETFVFRDGLIVDRVGQRYKVFERLQASPESLERLNDVLARVRIGQQTGNCTYPRLAPRPEESYTWFGRGRRQTTLLFGTRFTQTCSVELQELLQEILGFLAFGAIESEMVELRE